jgi:hypothetical protein
MSSRLVPARGAPERTRAILFLAAAATIGLMVEPLLSLVTALGHYIHPTSDLPGDYIKAWFTAVIFAFSILLWPVPRRERLTLLGLWTAKVIVVLGFMLVYEWHYDSLDAVGYYASANDPAFDFSELGLGSGTSNVMAMAWVVARTIPESFHGLKVVFSMIGLVAVYLFFRAWSIASGTRDIRLLLLIALTPSVLFWSSTLGKDPVALFAMALYAYGVVRAYVGDRGRLGGIGWATAGIVIALGIRLWLGPIMIAPLVVLVVARVKGRSWRVVTLAVWVALMGASVILVRKFFLREVVTDVVGVASRISQSWAKGGSAQQLDLPLNSTRQFVAFLPKGMVTALFRPFPGEVNNAFGMLAGMENAGLLMLLVLAVWRTRWRELSEPLVAWSVTLIAIWAAAYAVVSYQNLGTAVRFRLQILPVLLLLLVYLSRKRNQNSSLASS